MQRAEGLQLPVKRVKCGTEALTRPQPSLSPKGKVMTEPGPPTPTSPAGPAPAYRSDFAKPAGRAVAAVASLTIIVVIALMLSIDKDSLGADGKIAVVLLTAVLLIGIVVLAVGVWLAVVEWHGAMKIEPAGMRSLASVAPIVEAVGKLKGAALVLTVGGLLVFSVAWSAKDALPEPVNSTPTPSASPTGSS